MLTTITELDEEIMLLLDIDSLASLCHTKTKINVCSNDFWVKKYKHDFIEKPWICNAMD